LKASPSYRRGTITAVFGDRNTKVEMRRLFVPLRRVHFSAQ
jgi:hypothetical protein